MARKPTSRSTKRGAVDPPAAARPDTPPASIFGALDRDACDALLARNTVGRIAFSFHDRVDIEPIHYVYEEGWIYGRTSPGSKIATLQQNPWVAFEVDDVRGPLDWESVVVHGTFYTLAPAGTEVERHAWQRARDAVQRLTPQAWTDEDPVPFRTILFRIYVSEVTGRVAKDRDD